MEAEIESLKLNDEVLYEGLMNVSRCVAEKFLRMRELRVDWTKFFRECVECERCDLFSLMVKLICENFPFAKLCIDVDGVECRVKFSGLYSFTFTHHGLFARDLREMLSHKN